MNEKRPRKVGCWGKEAKYHEKKDTCGDCVIEKIRPVSKNSRSAEDKNQQEERHFYGDCSICLEEIQQNNNCTTSCNHKFHLSCMLKLASLHSMGSVDTMCPMCRRELLHSRSEQDRLLLKAVIKQNWKWMWELRDSGAQFCAAVEEGEYNHDCDVGMMPLHFAVRDHAPLHIIKQIYKAYPAALYVRAANCKTPAELLRKESPDSPSYSPEQYNEVVVFVAYLLWTCAPLVLMSVEPVVVGVPTSQGTDCNCTISAQKAHKHTTQLPHRK